MMKNKAVLYFNDSSLFSYFRPRFDYIAAGIAFVNLQVQDNIPSYYKHM